MKISNTQVNFAGIALEYPAVEVSIAGKRYREWKADGKGGFSSGPLKLRVTYSLIPDGLRKHLEIVAKEALPTPDYLLVDRQFLPDSRLKRCGYQASCREFTGRPGEEEGGGLMPGCGYPLIGEHFFVALEHQAGFNTVLEQNAEGTLYELRQHPVWEEGRLATIDAVLVASPDPMSAFWRYLASFRLPDLTQPMFSFCSFWSEPYAGNYEYRIGGDNYRSFVLACSDYGLQPDVYTLDAGWHDRQSIFSAKAECGGDEGLIALHKLFESNHSKLGLWLSYNGPMGFSPDYLKSLGIAVGAGESSTYCGAGFGVLMDKKLEALLTARFCELAGTRFGAVHFKIDWDNDCASSPEFQSCYLTRNHVREASVTVQNRIALAIRAVNPEIILRHGWWPSPWQLRYTNHLFLADSGDSEYSSYPALTQRDSSLTARDIQYYNHLQRDCSMIPLTCIDNHDFPQAPRNPFTGSDAVWSNTALLAVMRGSTYLPWTLQPEALEPSQIKILRTVMDFARRNASHIFVPNGKMIGGHPGHGEIYGYLHPGTKQTWCVLRNPAPIPQVWPFDAEKLTGGKVSQVRQIYPDCREIPAAGELLLTAHEVKILIFSARAVSMPWKLPFQMYSNESSYRCYFPASLSVNQKVCPRVATVYQVPEFEFSELIEERTPEFRRLLFHLRSPYRMREFQFQFRISGEHLNQTQVELFHSRASGASSCCYAAPVTEVHAGKPGLGERRNPESCASPVSRFFTAPAPCGGDAYFRLDLYGKDIELELWAVGFEAPSRNWIERKTPLNGVNQVMPPPHPLGFPRAIRLPLAK